MGFLSSIEISQIGFKHIGTNVKISNSAKFYGAERISLSDNIRIDDFCVLSAGEGGIEIGSYVHIAVYSSLIGKGKILVGNYSAISSRVSIYSSNDDYSGDSMTNPLILDDYKKTYHADVTLKEHVIIGSGSVILPGVVLENGVAIGALSLVKMSCKEFTIHAGNPARFIKDRKKNILALEKDLLLNK
jgi:galactoside O-acetyltransferase